MRTILIILGVVIIAVIILVVYSCMIVSSRCSRLEEEYFDKISNHKYE